MEEYVPLDLIATHPFFVTLHPRHQEELAILARRCKFQSGDAMLRAGDAARTFYVIGHGIVNLTSAIPGGGSRTIQTLSDGDVLGWSWLFPPYRWHFDAQAATLVRAIAFDAALVRHLCEEDHELGFYLMRQFANVMLGRLQTARAQLLEEWEGIL